MRPLAARLAAVQDALVAPLAAVGVRPNHVTAAGFLAAAAAGYLAWEGSLRWAGAVYLIGSSLDALDGALARKSGTASAFGAYFDSLLDRAGEGALLVGVAAWYAADADEAGVALAVAALLTSLLVSYARARAEGLGIAARSGVAPRPVRIVLLAGGLLLLVPGWALAAVALLSAVTVVQRTVEVWRKGRP